MKTAGLTDCQAGWLLVSLDDGCDYKLVGEDELQEILESADRVFTDIPLGLRDEEPERECDLLLKEKIGRELAVGVVMPPPRLVLEAPSYVEANMMYYESTGKELPISTWHLTPRIRTLDLLIRKNTSVREILFQSHPELLLMRLNGQQIFQNRGIKKGLKHRLDLITGQVPEAGELYRTLKEEYRRNEIEELDILDATTLAYGAARATEGEALTLPEEPLKDSQGVGMAIWYI
ncbi:MAG: DUF429 domain-containing protein [Balneolaceae bacterium]